MRGQFDSAVPAGEDPREYARVLARVHAAALSGRTPPARPRQVIGASWQRARGHGVDPDTPLRIAPLGVDELQRRRGSSRLADLLPTLRQGLTCVADEARHIMVVSDSDGRVLWREGSPDVRRQADRLGFVEGAAWDEDSVGTNAIGTALVTRSRLQVFSAEPTADRPLGRAGAPPFAGRAAAGTDGRPRAGRRPTRMGGRSDRHRPGGPDRATPAHRADAPATARVRSVLVRAAPGRLADPPRPGAGSQHRKRRPRAGPLRRPAANGHRAGRDVPAAPAARPDAGPPALPLRRQHRRPPRPPGTPAARWHGPSRRPSRLCASPAGFDIGPGR